MEFIPANLPELYIGFSKDFVKAQSEVEGAIKDSANPHLKSKYADLASCWDACKRALHGNGFAVLQWVTAGRDNEEVGITTELLHGPTGQSKSCTFYLGLKDPKNPQVVGSAITYGRRYGLCAAIGICPEDDDGEAAKKAPKESEPKELPAGSLSDDKMEPIVADWMAEFSKADLAGKKNIYRELKAKFVQEPQKSQLLNQFAEAIKKETNSNG